jgi:hypothetical protein
MANDVSWDFPSKPHKPQQCEKVTIRDFAAERNHNLSDLLVALHAGGLTADGATRNNNNDPLFSRTELQRCMIRGGLLPAIKGVPSPAIKGS